MSPDQLKTLILQEICSKYIIVPIMQQNNIGVNVGKLKLANDVVMLLNKLVREIPVESPVTDQLPIEFFESEIFDSNIHNLKNDIESKQ